MAGAFPAQPMLSEAMDTFVVFDGLPVVPLDKYEKLTAVVKSRFGAAIVRVNLPFDDAKKMSRGFAFVEYKTAADASDAVSKSGLMLDAKHSITVTHFASYDRLKSTKDEYEAPDLSHLTSKKPNLRSWLNDARVRDQFVVRFNADTVKETVVYWSDPLHASDKDHLRQVNYGGEREKKDGKVWTEYFVKWSPKGSFLATFHSQGIVLWGNEYFDRFARVVHKDVTHIEFSPCERFVATVSKVEGAGFVTKTRDHFQTSFGSGDGSTSSGAAEGAESAVRKHKVQVNVYEVKATPQLLTTFAEDLPESQWTSLKWSHDGKYFLRTSSAGITLFDTGRSAEKLIKLPDVREAQWCPTRNAISYILPGKGDQPDTVSVWDVATDRSLREKHYFAVAKLTSHWQAAGTYLCLQVTRFKTKKSFTHTLDVVRFDDKKIPIDELPLTHPVARLAFEPNAGGRTFAITSEVTAPGQNLSHCELSLYRMGKKIDQIGKFQLPLQGQQSHVEQYQLFWSPVGRTLIAAAFDPFCTLTFIDTTGAPEILAEQRHDRMNDLQWDPSGRTVVTAALRDMLLASRGEYHKDKATDSYALWTFQGTALVTVPVEKLYQILWRPRPAPLLSADQLAAVHGKLKDTYYKRFDHEAEEVRKATQSDAVKRRQEIKRSWKALKDDLQSEWDKEREVRRQLRNGVASDSEELVELEVEEAHLDNFIPPQTLFTA